ncbi:MAG: hypothetical protein ACLVL2_11935 [Bacteroides cellulosilyticus]
MNDWTAAVDRVVCLAVAGHVCVSTQKSIPARLNGKKAKEDVPKRISPGYKPAPVSKHLFMADNDGGSIVSTRHRQGSDSLPFCRMVREPRVGVVRSWIAGTHKSDTGMNPWGKQDKDGAARIVVRQR